MDIIRSKLLIVSLFMITMYFWLLSFSAHAASRGISVISDLSHQSGKLGAYKALIIGINDYKDPNIPDLETAVNDANALANILSDRYGFEVKRLLDRKATREAIYRALRSLASSTEADDSVLIYYAGHGERRVIWLFGRFPFCSNIFCQVDQQKKGVEDEPDSDCCNELFSCIALCFVYDKFAGIGTGCQAFVQ